MPQEFTGGYGRKRGGGGPLTASTRAAPGLRHCSQGSSRLSRASGASADDSALALPAPAPPCAQGAAFQGPLLPYLWRPGETSHGTQEGSTGPSPALALVRPTVLLWMAQLPTGVPAPLPSTASSPWPLPRGSLTPPGPCEHGLHDPFRPASLERDKRWLQRDLPEPCPGPAMATSFRNSLGGCD